jgi:hypothetical protein
MSIVMENIGEQILTPEQKQQVEFFRLMFTTLWGIPKKPEETVPEVKEKRPRRPTDGCSRNRKPLKPEYFIDYYHNKKEKVPCPKCGRKVFDMNLKKHYKQNHMWFNGGR